MPLAGAVCLLRHYRFNGLASDDIAAERRVARDIGHSRLVPRFRGPTRHGRWRAVDRPFWSCTCAGRSSRRWCRRHGRNGHLAELGAGRIDVRDAGRRAGRDRRLGRYIAGDIGIPDCHALQRSRLVPWALGRAGQVAIPGVVAVLLHGGWTAGSIFGALGIVPLFAALAVLLLAGALRTNHNPASLTSAGLAPHPSR